MSSFIEDRLLDARGLYCPMPVVKAGRELKSLEPGQVLKVLVNDPAARTDFPAWVEDTGKELVEANEAPDGSFVFLVRKGDGEE
jgi:tRNA 2-thiouridine synthesizing protein A